MIRPHYKTRKIISAVAADEPNREVITLECGHEQVQAIRPQRRKRAFCLECSSDAP